MTGIERIAAERKRQIEEEGWTEAHDDEHIVEELALAGACYALPEYIRNYSIWEDRLLELLWPWPFSTGWWKPSPENRIRELEKAGALIAAEIDRLQRL